MSALHRHDEDFASAVRHAGLTPHPWPPSRAPSRPDRQAAIPPNSTPAWATAEAARVEDSSHDWGSAEQNLTRSPHSTRDRSRPNRIRPTCRSCRPLPRRSGSSSVQLGSWTQTASGTRPQDDSRWDSAKLRHSTDSPTRTQNSTGNPPLARAHRPRHSRRPNIPPHPGRPQPRQPPAPPTSGGGLAVSLVSPHSLAAFRSFVVRIRLPGPNRPPVSLFHSQFRLARCRLRTAWTRLVMRVVEHRSRQRSRQDFRVATAGSTSARIFA